LPALARLFVWPAHNWYKCQNICIKFNFYKTLL